MFESTMRPGFLVDAVNMCCPKISLVDDKVLGDSSCIGGCIIFSF